ncbi:hypothetical protein ACPDHQ_07340 [Myroides odoratimimus]|uniref:hypothetical protein n=1 Tax=Myroides odoratimimus TaxID=76832 RepID=UPI003D2F95F6
MNLNIAFNTIIYIMVFLFPGIIYRKFFFRGKFKNQFEHGNVLERFLWNILTSVLCIFSFGILIYYFTDIYEYKLFKTLEYKDIYNLFNDLSKNTFPKKLEDIDGLKLFVQVFAFLYLYSALLGYLSFFLVTRFKLDRRFSFFRFNNHWEYFANVNSSNFKKLKLFKSYATYVDILISNKEGKDLYRGRLHEIIYDKDNKIEHIALKDALKFNQIKIDKDTITVEDVEGGIEVKGQFISEYNIHIRRPNKIIYKKFIDGHIFVIPNNNIDNLNFTYVEISDGFKLKAIGNILLITIIIIGFSGILFLIANLFFNIIFPEYLNSFFKRFVFTVASIYALVILIDLHSTNFKNINKEKNTYYNIYLILLISTSFLWLFEVLTGLQFLILFILSSFYNMLKIPKFSLNLLLYVLCIMLYLLILNYVF